ncbi:MAG: M1 family peptidase [Planctomycetes bacterium]|nr:M1 family peptidase [Planctomycetota bacterium]
MAAFASGCFGGIHVEPEDDGSASTGGQSVAEKQRAIFAPLESLPPGNSIRTASGAPGPDYWQQQVDYVLEATLDADTRRVTGHALITYHNNSPDPLAYLWAHVEQNIFREDSIGAAIETRTPIGMHSKFGEGCTIEYVRVPASVAQRAQELSYHVYDTVMKIDLPQPVAANGGRAEVEIAWSFTVPNDTFRRFGAMGVEEGTIFEVAQWFPAMAVYDDVHGWNTLPYLGTGEFYTNFGNYDLRITVPATHLVAATGELMNPSEVYTPDQLMRYNRAQRSRDTVVIRSADEVADPKSRPRHAETLTWHFKAENVRTVAWASSEAFIQDACRHGQTLMQSFYTKEALPVWSESSQMLATAIGHYNEQWFEYPYPTANNIYGPEWGMEYPMIIFCRSSRSSKGLYGLVAHEIGHNWFPMVVNTDERRHAWMDEGFDSFINYLADLQWPNDPPKSEEGDEEEAGDENGSPPARSLPKEPAVLGNPKSFAKAMQRPSNVPVDTYPDRLPPDALGRLQYRKPAVGLSLLRSEILGKDRFDDAFRTYIHRWAFKSPRPADFFRSIEDAAGMDLAWFWRGWFLTNSVVDQSVVRVSQAFETLGGDGEEEGEGVDEASGGGDTTVVGTIKAVIGTSGGLVMPVTITVLYEDGTTDVRTLPVDIWYNTDEFEATWTSDSPAVSIVVDSARHLPDVNRKNNVWPHGEAEGEEEGE